MKHDTKMFTVAFLNIVRGETARPHQFKRERIWETTMAEKEDERGGEASHGRGHGDQASLPLQTRIAWSKEDQAFRVVEAKHDERNGSDDGKRVSQAAMTRSGGSLEQAMQDLLSLSVEMTRDEPVMEELVEFRRDILDQILRPVRPESLRLLPDFLKCWHQGLSHVLSGYSRLEPSVVALICDELQELAETEMLVGGIIQARAALGQCISLARRHDLDARDSIVGTAKNLLIRCVQFQEQMKLCIAGLDRKNAPLPVQREILRILSQLQTQAPHSADVMVLYVGVMTKMRRSREIVTSLSDFAFTTTNAQLTLLYVRALEYEGFYNDSISVATSFHENHANENNGKLRRSLEMHAEGLRSVLKDKMAAEDALAQSQFEEAETEFSDALHRTDKNSHRLRAALLFSGAMRGVGQEQFIHELSGLEGLSEGADRCSCHRDDAERRMLEASPREEEGG